MKKVLLLIISLFIFAPSAYANTISSINMDVYIDSNGDAYITEIWNASVYEGTELYHPYFNIGTSEITLLEASMSDKPYTIVNEWDIDSDIKTKSYKAGIYKTGNEIDICLGISSYGVNEYKFKYKISDFVLKTIDADVVYWTLFPYDFSVEPNQVNIKIYSDFNYSNELPVWGYGNYGGLAAVDNGVVLFESDGELDSNEYMTILIKYPKDTFNTTNTTINDFSYYYDMAEEGAVHNKKNSIIKVVIDIILFLIGLLPYIFVFWMLKKAYSQNTNKLNLDYGKLGNKVRKDVPNFRDIPCNKDIVRAYFIGMQYNLIKKQENLMGAFILSWIKNGNVKIEKITKSGILKDKEQSVIVFIKPPQTYNSEITLYNWMLQASKDARLESREFEKWCYSNSNKIFEWFKTVLEEQRDKLIDEGKIKKEEKGNIFKSLRYVVDSSLMNEAEQLAGLKKFLIEFSRIKEREAIEVHLWNEYLIFAQMFGIADKVAKQFKDLYPEINQYIEQQNYDLDSIMYINYISNVGFTSARRKRQEEIASKYSSGGGGFSSGGGGGGSFGGGGGGGGFR